MQLKRILVGLCKAEPIVARNGDVDSFECCYSHLLNYQYNELIQFNILSLQKCSHSFRLVSDTFFFRVCLMCWHRVNINSVPCHDHGYIGYITSLHHKHHAHEE